MAFANAIKESDIRLSSGSFTLKVAEDEFDYNC